MFTGTDEPSTSRALHLHFEYTLDISWPISRFLFVFFASRFVFDPRPFEPALKRGIYPTKGHISVSDVELLVYFSANRFPWTPCL